MPAALLVTMVAGTALDAYGKYSAGQAAKKAADFNAQAAELQANDAIQRGTEDEQRFRVGLKTLIGSQRAGFAGQNVAVDSGSAVDVQADSAYLGELDAQNIRLNAQREAWGYRTQAQSYRQTGQAAATAGKLGAASTVLGNTTSLLASRYGWGKAS